MAAADKPMRRRKDIYADLVAEGASDLVLYQSQIWLDIRDLMAKTAMTNLSVEEEEK